MNTWQSDYLFGVEADKDTDTLKILDAVLNGWHGIHVADLTVEQQSALQEGLSFNPLFSVLKSQWDEIGGHEWHTEGAGKRSKPAWWIDSTLVESVLEQP